MDGQAGREGSRSYEELGYVHAVGREGIVGCGCPAAVPHELHVLKVVHDTATASAARVRSMARGAPGLVAEPLPGRTSIRGGEGTRAVRCRGSGRGPGGGQRWPAPGRPGRAVFRSWHGRLAGQHLDSVGRAALGPGPGLVLGPFYAVIARLPLHNPGAALRRRAGTSSKQIPRRATGVAISPRAFRN